MTRNELNIALCAVIATVDECQDAGPVPQGVVYAGLMTRGYTLDDYYTVQSIMVKAQLAVVGNDTLKLTEAGRKMAQQIREFEETHRG